MTNAEMMNHIEAILSKRCEKLNAALEMVAEFPDINANELLNTLKDDRKALKTFREFRKASGHG